MCAILRSAVGGRHTVACARHCQAPPAVPYPPPPPLPAQLPHPPSLPLPCLQLLGLPTFMPESDWSVDYEAGRKLIEATGSRVFEAPMHVEGGSIHSDGEG